MKKITIILFGIMLGVNACYYDRVDELYPISTCDTTTAVAYSQIVVPLFQSQCYSCHTTANAGGGIVMGTYATDKAITDNGTLYGSIAHASGFSPMPKGLPKLTDCQLQQIKKWIDSGSPNN